MIKKLYILPNTIITMISTSNMLVVSWPNQLKTKKNSSETCCPFNGLWCVKKQNRLDEWENAVKTYSKEQSNKVFYTRGDMFDGCPFDYTSLCKKHNQRQRD